MGAWKSMFKRIRCTQFESVTPSRKKVTGPDRSVYPKKLTSAVIRGTPSALTHSKLVQSTNLFEHNKYNWEYNFSLNLIKEATSICVKKTKCIIFQFFWDRRRIPLSDLLSVFLVTRRMNFFSPFCLAGGKKRPRASLPSSNPRRGIFFPLLWKILPFTYQTLFFPFLCFRNKLGGSEGWKRTS